MLVKGWITSPTNAVWCISEGTGELLAAGGKMAVAGIRVGIDASISFAARSYFVSNNAINITVSWLNKNPAVLVELQGVIGHAVGYLNNKGAEIVTGMSLVDYTATVTQFAIHSYGVVY